MVNAAIGERYHDRVVSWLTAFAMAWSILGMLAGVYVAAELVWPTIDFGREWLSYGRLRTLHTNGVIFGFGVSALMGTAFYSVQRTCHVPLFAPRLAWFCALAWQVGVLAGGVSLLAGWNGGKEYAELEWPFDIAIAVVWVCFAIVFFGTIAKRRIKPIYVSNWFYGGLIIVIAMLHIVNSLAVPVTLSKSYSLFAGAQDAIVQWWYGHNAVGFLLTGGFLGMLYYFLPKHAGRPIWSYRLSIVAFWAFTYSYIWAGPHHLHYNAVPEWVQSLGMVMSLVLLAPSWATMVNGVMTVAGAWEKLRTDPALKFIVLSLAFYGLATFEGPMMSIKSVNMVSHFTDWTIGHCAFGGARLERHDHLRVRSISWCPGWSARTSTASGLPTSTSGWRWRAPCCTSWRCGGAGVSQGLLWLSLDEIGELSFSFKDIMASMAPYYALRFLAGLIFLGGALLMAFNLTMTGKGRRTVAVSPPAAGSSQP